MSQIAQDAVTTETSGTGPDDTTEDTQAQELLATAVEQDTDKDTTEESKTFDAAYVQQLRKEAADHRVKAKEAGKAAKEAAEKARSDLAQQIGKALGLVEEDKPQDPDELMKQLTTKDGELKKKTVELALYQTAAKPEVGADPDALLDSRSFMRRVDKLDSSAESFMSDLESLITETVAASPRYQRSAGQVPERSGGEITGGSGERHNTNPEDLSIEEHRKARRKNRGIE